MALKRATTSFHAATKDGAPRYIQAGDLLDEKDPVAKGNPDYFEDPTSKPGPVVHRARPAEQVEQATAAPGEKRSTRQPRKRAAKKTAAKKTAAAEPKKAAEPKAGDGEPADNGDQPPAGGQD